MIEKTVQRLEGFVKQFIQILSLVSIGIATLLYWKFGFLMHPAVWFLFYPAIFICAWIGGLWLNLISTFLTVALASYLFIDLKYLIPILIIKIYIILLFLLIPGAIFFWRITKRNQALIIELKLENSKLKEEIKEKDKKLAYILKEN